MAGFRQRAAVRWDMAMVAHPSVTLLVDLSESEGTVYDSGGRYQFGGSPSAAQVSTGWP